MDAWVVKVHVVCERPLKHLFPDYCVLYFVFVASEIIFRLPSLFIFPDVQMYRNAWKKMLDMYHKFILFPCPRRDHLDSTQAAATFWYFIVFQALLLPFQSHCVYWYHSSFQRYIAANRNADYGLLTYGALVVAKERSLVDSCVSKWSPLLWCYFVFNFTFCKCNPRDSFRTA